MSETLEVFFGNGEQFEVNEISEYSSFFDLGFPLHFERQLK